MVSKPTIDGCLFMARVWREYAMAWDGRPTSTTGVGREWVEKILKISREQCLKKSRECIREARMVRSPLAVVDQSFVSDHNGENYIASIRRPDGSVVRVLIPVEGVDCHENDVIKDSDTVKGSLGLNLVSECHYS